VILSVPYLVIRHTVVHFDSLVDKKMQVRFGHLYENLRLNGSKTVFLQPTFFLLRRLILAIAFVKSKDYLIWQVYMIWAQTIIALFIMEYTRPFNTEAKRRMELFNEFMIMLVLYTMMCFSPFVPETDA